MNMRTPALSCNALSQKLLAFQNLKGRRLCSLFSVLGVPCPQVLPVLNVLEGVPKGEIAHASTITSRGAAPTNRLRYSRAAALAQELTIRSACDSIRRTPRRCVARLRERPAPNIASDAPTRNHAVRIERNLALDNFTAAQP